MSHEYGKFPDSNVKKITEERQNMPPYYLYGVIQVSNLY